MNVTHINIIQLIKGHFSYLKSSLAALLAGAAMPLAFAPLGFFPAAVLAPALLLILWLNSTPKAAFWQGLWFGCGMYGVGVSWVFISIHEFGNTPVLLAAVFTSLFVMLLASFTALQGYIFKRYYAVKQLATLLFVFPALWVAMEWLRSWIFSGFPWLLAAYSQIDSPLAGYIPVVGEYGVGYLVLLSSALLIAAVKSRKQSGYFLIAVLGIWIVGGALKQYSWTQLKTRQPLSVALIQGDIPQAMKWNSDYLNKTLQTYLDLTRKNWSKNIIVWPESAIPLPYHEAKDFIQALATEARQHSTALLIGVPIRQITTTDFNDYYYNGMFAIGNGKGVFYKRHLVPFGEYLPLKSFLHGLIAFFDIPMSDFVPGAMQQANLQAAGIQVAPFICYEVAYAEIVRQNLPQAELLVTSSNDSWFGQSLAPWQHLEIGRFRALQTGRYMLFAGNSGITAIINAKGKITAEVPPFKEAVLAGQAYPMIGTTPWVKIGTTPIIVILLIGLVGLGIRRKYY